LGKSIFPISYIIRIYRRRKNKPDSLIGIVEEVGKNGKQAFTKYNELWEILSSPVSFKSRLRGNSKKGKRGSHENKS
jgi:hypothetical protein